jgi:HSP20 family molecular chaperone IbpA
MSFWNVNLDELISTRLYFDESILAYMFHTADWYGGNNSWYNRYTVFHDIVEWNNADHTHLQKEELLEEFPDIIPDHNKQEWPEELVIDEEHQTTFEERENAKPEVGRNKRRKETKKPKRSPNHSLSFYVNDDPRIYVHPEPDDEEKEVTKGEVGYPLDIIRSDGLIRITTQTPFVNDKNNIKVKVYNDSSVEISIDDDSLQNNKKYYRVVKVPKDADIETAKCTHRNSILEITFKQKNVLD